MSDQSKFWKTGSFVLQLLTLNVFQEDISKLRRKIEKAKKPAEKISNGDDILNEEINDYKVGFDDTKKYRIFCSFSEEQFSPMSHYGSKSHCDASDPSHCENSILSKVRLGCFGWNIPSRR